MHPQHLKAVAITLLAICTIAACLDNGSAQGVSNSSPAQGPRKSGEQDREKLLAAQSKFAEAEQLWAQETPESLRPALEKYEESLQLCRAANAPELEARLVLTLGFIHSKLGETQKAVNHLRQARSLYQALGDKKGEAVALSNLAMIFFTVGELTRALEHFNLGLQLYRAIEGREMEGDTLNNLGVVLSASGDHLKAIESHDQALAIFRAGKYQAKEGATLNHLGKAYNAAGKRQESIKAFTLGLSVWQELGDRQMESATLASLGAIYSAMGKKSKSIDILEQTVELHRAQGNRRGEAAALRSLGIFLSTIGSEKRTREYLSQSLAIWRAEGAEWEEAMILIDLGNVTYAAGSKEKAIDYYQQALKLPAIEGSPREKYSLLTSIGYAYLTMGDKPKAIDYYNQSLPYRRALGLPIVLGNVTPEEIEFQYSRINSEKQQFSRLARNIRRGPSDDPREEADRLSRVGVGYAMTGNRMQALNQFNQALALWRKINHRLGEAKTLIEIGSLHRWSGERELAHDYFDQALSLFRAEGSRENEARALERIASNYASLREYQKAIDSYQEAARLWQKVGDAQRSARPISSVNRSTQSSAGPQREGSSGSNPGDQSSGPLAGGYDPLTIGYLYQSIALSNIAYQYESLGEKERAIDYRNQALKLERSFGFSRYSDLARIAQLYASMGERQKAAQHLDEAIEDFTQYMKRLKRSGSFTEALGREQIGGASAALGEKRQALDYLKRAAAIYESVNERRWKAGALSQISRLERDEGRLEEARKQAEAALEIVESMRAGSLTRTERESYSFNLLNHYEIYIDVLMLQHRAAPAAGHDLLALQASERSRARNLLETLTEARADIRKGIDPKLLERERALKQQFNVKAALHSELVRSPNPDETEIGNLATQIKTLNQELNKLQDEINLASPRYAGLTRPQPVSITDIQQQLLDDETILLEYTLGEDRSYLWAVSKTAIASYELPKGKEINAAAKTFYNALRVHTSSKSADETRMAPGGAKSLEVAAAAAELSRLVLGPVAGQLGQKRLLIVADGLLHYVPFAALADPTASTPERFVPLVVGHEIVTIPSASTLALMRRELAGRRPAPKAVAVLADPVFEADDSRLQSMVARSDSKSASTSAETSRLIKYASSKLGGKTASEQVRIPRLPYSRRESEVIAALAGEKDTKMVVDFAANLGMATNPELSQYRIVHFATHGIFDSEYAELSGLVFSLVDERGVPQDGFLRINDVYNLNLPADLVVLSACQTGLGRQVKGEGLVGLTRGFMYAGAARVMVSLWSVNDKATSELMASFYRAMLKEGLRPAAALRAAQIEMWRQKEWESPYYWASFVLQGEWK